MHAPPSSTRWRQPDMFGAIISFVTGLLGKLLGSLFGKKDPSVTQLAASNANVNAKANNLEAANEALVKGATANADVDARLLHEQRGGPDSINSSLDSDPDLPFRD